MQHAVPQLCTIYCNGGSDIDEDDDEDDGDRSEGGMFVLEALLVT